MVMAWVPCANSSSQSSGLKTLGCEATATYYLDSLSLKEECVYWLTLSINWPQDKHENIDQFVATLKGIHVHCAFDLDIQGSRHTTTADTHSTTVSTSGTSTPEIRWSAASVKPVDSKNTFVLFFFAILSLTARPIFRLITALSSNSE